MAVDTGLDDVWPVPLPAGKSAVATSGQSPSNTVSATMDSVPYQTSPSANVQPSGLDATESAYLATGFWTTYSNNAPPPHSWGAGQTVDVAANPASNFSNADLSGIQNAIALWRNVANINLVFDTPTGNSATDTHTYNTASIQITRGTDQGAHTSATYYTTLTGAGGSGSDLLSQATTSIDTGVPSFADLHDVAQQDTSGYGGYGFLTLIHELGHALGLGHGGPYNGAIDPSLQNGAHDTRQCSVMSYYNPQDVGGQANYNLNGVNYYSQTPMLDDVLAVQSIYGTPTRTTAATTFGFNATATLPQEYNFNLDQVPIVTLYGGSTNGQSNTLDLSGFSTSATVDLNPGTFSSCAGLTDNVCIGYGTSIDNVVGTTGGTTFVANGDSDTITGLGGSNKVIFSQNAGSYSVRTSGSTTYVTDGGVTDTLNNIQLLQFADLQEAPCFADGTLILTEDGEIAVGQLRPGMRAVTLDPVTGARGLSAIVWIGRRTVDVGRCAHPALAAPVVFVRDSIGPGAPSRDLVVSPDHAVFVDGMLIAAHRLVNGRSIRQDRTPRCITYWHVELAAHAVLVADGLPAESYLASGNRHRFTRARGMPAVSGAQQPCVPYVTDSRRLEPVWRRYADRAGVAAMPETRRDEKHAPTPTLVVGARTLKLIESSAGRLSVPIPRDAAGQVATLCADATCPADRMPWEGDRRKLGLPIRRILAQGPGGTTDVAIDAPHLTAGWWPPERDGAGQVFRWSGQAASLALPPETWLLEFMLAA